MICPYCRKVIPSPAEQLRAAIDAARLSDAAAARRLGVPRQQLSGWLCGVRVPRGERLAELLAALELASKPRRAPLRHHSRGRPVVD